MIAVVASVALTLYLQVPSSIFRLLFGFFVPLRSFVRTRGEEIFQGVVSVLLPVVLAFILVRAIPPFDEHPFDFPDTPESRSTDYKLLVSALNSESFFTQSGDAVWKALARTERRQGRFLCWFYLLTFCEGLSFGTLSIFNPKLRRYGWYRWTFNKILLPNISEWHVLLTPFFFRDKRTIVRADILCVDNTLYSGKVVEHSLSKESLLAGVIITDAKRYDRESYLKDKALGPADKDKYWRPIPGAKLYLFADKILNLNLTYEGPEAPPNVLADVLSRLLKKTIVVEVKPSPGKS